MADKYFVTPPASALVTAKPNLRVSGYKTVDMIDFTHRVYSGDIGTFVAGKFGTAPNKEIVICVKLTNPIPSSENGGLGIITEAWFYEDLVTWPGRGVSTTHPPVLIPYIPSSTVKPPVTDPAKNDDPKTDPDIPNMDTNVKDESKSDLTNTYLTVALIVVTFFKFLLPRLRD